MKKLKRIFTALALVLCLCLPLALTACGNSDDGGNEEQKEITSIVSADQLLNDAYLSSIKKGNLKLQRSSTDNGELSNTTQYISFDKKKTCVYSKNGNEVSYTELIKQGTSFIERDYQTGESKVYSENEVTRSDCYMRFFPVVNFIDYVDFWSSYYFNLYINNDNIDYDNLFGIPVWSVTEEDGETVVSLQCKGVIETLDSGVKKDQYTEMVIKVYIKDGLVEKIYTCAKAYEIGENSKPNDTAISTTTNTDKYEYSTSSLFTFDTTDYSKKV